MYYHLIMEDGLKYKDLSIEELEKIINEEEVSYNNSRVYSSEKKLNQIFEMYKDDLNEQQNDVNLENIKIIFIHLLKFYLYKTVIHQGKVKNLSKDLNRWLFLNSFPVLYCKILNNSKI